MTHIPKEVMQYLTHADQAIENKEFEQAIVILNGIIRENPNYAPAYRQIGSILMHSRSPEKAREYLNKAIELAPDDAESWSTLGVFHKNSKELADSLKAFMQAMHYGGESAGILLEILRIHRTLGNHQQAFAVLRKLHQLDFDNALYLYHYAQLLKETGKKKEALVEYNQLLKRKREEIPVEAIEEWYDMMAEAGHTKEARDRLKILSEENPKDAILKLLYGYSCEDNLNYHEAYLALKESYELDSENLRTIHALGYILNVMGNTKDAQKYYLKAIAINPFATDALRTIGERHRYQYGDLFFQRLNFAAVHISRFNTKGRLHLHYAMGKAYDDVGELKTAFEHYRLGGKLHLQSRQGKPFEIEHLKEIFTKSIDKQFMYEHQDLGLKSNKPVFIVGMPRSGTTLIEQVLSGIRGVYGAGELSYINEALKGIVVGEKKINPKGLDPFPQNSLTTYRDRAEYYLRNLEALAPAESSRIIDKMPTNFMFLGLIHLLFPNASIIHSRRHPVETCLSAYRILFSNGHYWSDDLKEMGRYYRNYIEMMQHWKNILPDGVILDVRYEDMVADLENQSKRLAAYIDMPWSEACLDFHQSKRAIRTASISQVRQPIYTASVNRWHKYEPYLQPLLEEIGDLVEAYEAEPTTHFEYI